jgi:hypothetical protein
MTLSTKKIVCLSMQNKVIMLRFSWPLASVPSPAPALSGASIVLAEGSAIGGRRICPCRVTNRTSRQLSA